MIVMAASKKEIFAIPCYLTPSSWIASASSSNAVVLVPCEISTATLLCHEEGLKAFIHHALF